MKRNGLLVGHQRHSQLEFMKTALFLHNFKELSLVEINHITKKKSTFVNAKWIAEDKPVNRRSRDLHDMFKCGMPEEAKFMSESLVSINKALQLAGLQDISDEKTSFNEKSVEKTPDR